MRQEGEAGYSRPLNRSKGVYKQMDETGAERPGVLVHYGFGYAKPQGDHQK
jgi:hypothetical protein